MGDLWIWALAAGLGAGVLVGLAAGSIVRNVREDRAFDRYLADMRQRLEQRPITCARSEQPGPPPGVGQESRRKKHRPRPRDDCSDCYAREVADSLAGLTEIDKLTHTRWPRKRRR